METINIKFDEKRFKKVWKKVMKDLKNQGGKERLVDGRIWKIKRP